jgi:hypothetical protein
MTPVVREKSEAFRRSERDDIMDLSGAVLTTHALEQMAKRQIAESDVRHVLASPEEILAIRHRY